MKDQKKKKSSYISSGESRKITRFNRRVTKKFEKRREDAAKDPALYTTRMKDPNNVVEFDTTAVRYITIHSSKRATEWGNSLYEIVVSGEGDASVDQTLDQKAEAPNTFDFGKATICR